MVRRGDTALQSGLRGGAAGFALLLAAEQRSEHRLNAGGLVLQPLHPVLECRRNGHHRWPPDVFGRSLGLAAAVWLGHRCLEFDQGHAVVTVDAVLASRQDRSHLRLARCLVGGVGEGVLSLEVPLFASQ